MNALNKNTTGNRNTATGVDSLLSNTTGNNNTAQGFQAGFTATAANANTTGSNNTFIGYQAGPGASTQLTNAAAIGSNALVSANNALVLGDSSVRVGIGTPTPAAKLHVATGDVYVSNPGSGIILKSPDGLTCKRVSIDNSGALVTAALACL